MNFAYLEMKVILSLLLKRYALELVDRDPQPIAGAGTKWPQRPCRVRYRRRELPLLVPAVREQPAAAQCPMHVG